MKKYNVIMFSQKCKEKIIKRGLTLEIAKLWCGMSNTQGEDKRRGKWFYGFREVKK